MTGAVASVVTESWSLNYVGNVLLRGDFTWSDWWKIRISEIDNDIENKNNICGINQNSIQCRISSWNLAIKLNKYYPDMTIDADDVLRMKRYMINSTDYWFLQDWDFVWVNWWKIRISEILADEISMNSICLSDPTPLTPPCSIARWNYNNKIDKLTPEWGVPTTDDVLRLKRHYRFDPEDYPLRAISNYFNKIY